MRERFLSFRLFFFHFLSLLTFCKFDDSSGCTFASMSCTFFFFLSENGKLTHLILILYILLSSYYYLSFSFFYSYYSFDQISPSLDSYLSFLVFIFPHLLEDFHKVIQIIPVVLLDGFLKYICVCLCVYKNLWVVI